MSGRPPGEIRQAMVSAAERLVQQQGAEQLGVTWRDIGAAAQVGFAAARQYAKDLAKAGQFEVVGEKRVPGSCRPMRLYAPRRRDSFVMGGAELGDVLSRWARR